jgi:hypothetical protein
VSVTFQIVRTSVYGGQQPCRGAVKARHPRWDVRTCSAEEFDRKDLGAGTPWLGEGEEHRVLANGYIARRMGDVSGWVLGFGSVEELLAFAEEHGELVLSPAEYGLPGNLPTLEIYDDYRE